MDYNNINVVLIADRCSRDKQITLNTFDLEMANERYFNDVYLGLSSFCHSVKVYSSPKEFLNNIHKHKNDIVISIWSGSLSKSRKGLVPAICEAYGIKYVGSDCYVQILCQDKAMTKEYCKKFDINTPNYVIINKLDRNYDFSTLRFPIIVKPLWEGGSIGISKDNLVYDVPSARKMCKELLNFYDGIIAEEYIDGYELCVILFGNNRTIKMKGASMISVDGETFLKDFIWSYEFKKEIKSKKKIKSVNASHLLQENDWKKFEKLFFALGKVDLIRIDGRINENGFNLIELSPDPHIGSGASVAKVFGYNNIDYISMLKDLIMNSI